MKYVALISDRYDAYNRYWVTRNSLDEIKKVAREYEKDNKYLVDIYSASEVSE